ncbi:hypothetical protein EPUS_01128 [Endocarpon pusillum Z07020]|uniref:Uncharacterized protein n=1 Tax=Endocarpon pusillum (strain Z07020 / HMAS-L-300199) TaxID=1263415 RepID=U1GBX1_ENDPU|nr:uncharacterized protein EPUS_01128 [Endocarpon pusillum Z07020]ERF69171.1 hypothetical protein EPUS_01128 [Endocarpon pusillum Z07020]
MDYMMQSPYNGSESQQLLGLYRDPSPAISTNTTPHTSYYPKSYFFSTTTFINNNDNPAYLGTSTPGEAPLRWRPYTMHWAYLLAHVLLNGTVCVSLFLALRYSTANNGFSETEFPINSAKGVLVFQIIPAVIAIGFQSAWLNIDIDFKRLMPFLNLANPSPARRRCIGRKSGVPGSRGNDSLLLNYFPYTRWTADFRSPFRGHWVVATTFWTSFLTLTLVGYHAVLFTPQEFLVSHPLNTTSGLQFRRLSNWRSLIEDVYMSGLGKELAANDLRLWLDPSVDVMQSLRAWKRTFWSAVPFMLIDDVNGTSALLPPKDAIWQAETAVFYASLDCQPADVQFTASTQNLNVTFQDAMGCAAQHSYPLPSAGQYLSFWDVSQSYEIPACIDTQLLAWGKAMPTSEVIWTGLSCIPKYRMANLQVAVNAYGVVFLLDQDGNMTPYLTESLFDSVATDFISSNLTALVKSVFFDTGLASLSSYPASQVPFFAGLPQSSLMVDEDALLRPKNLTLTVQRTFSHVLSRLFTTSLFAASTASEPETFVTMDGIRFSYINRYGIQPTAVIFLWFNYAVMACSALGLAITVAFMKKYRMTGLKFDVTKAGIAGLMLLFHRSRQVLEQDFKDLDQSLRRSDLKKRLGEKIYRLGYWRDGQGVYWGISRESDGPTNQEQSLIPRIAPEDLPSFRYRSGKSDVHIVYVAVMVLLMSALAGSCLWLAISSSRNGLDPTFGTMSLTWAIIVWRLVPVLLTSYCFWWWKNVDMYCRATQPFGGLNKPHSADENICLDYRTDMALLLPWRAASNKHSKLCLVATGSLLSGIMLAVAPMLIVFRDVTKTTTMLFDQPINWKDASYTTPALEPYIYQTANLLLGSDAIASWTDGTSLYLPVAVDNSTNITGNSSIAMSGTWTFDTQRVMANLSNCVNLQVGLDLSVDVRDVQFDGQEGRIFNAMNLESSDCTAGTNINSVCGRSSSNSTTRSEHPEEVCGSWSLLSATGSCQHEGKWWIYRISGERLGYDAAGQTVFSARNTPVVTSLLCDTSIWLSEVTLVDFDPNRPTIDPTTVVVKSSEPFDKRTSNSTFGHLFNSLLNQTLAEISSNTSTASTSSLMTVLTLAALPNANLLSTPLGFAAASSRAFSTLFTLYALNALTLYPPSPTHTLSFPGTIHWAQTRVFVRVSTFSIYLFCLLFLLLTYATIWSTLRDWRLPRWIDTMADTVSYFYRSGSGILDHDFQGMQDVQDARELERRLLAKGRRYVLGEGIGRDGVSYVGIGDEREVRTIPRRRRRPWLVNNNAERPRWERIPSGP